MKRRASILQSALILLLQLAAIATQAADWPAFRGPLGDGRSDETNVIPEAGVVSFELKWKKPLGSGYSGIAVVDDRLVTQYSDGQDDFLIALDTASGETVWQHRLGTAYQGHDGSHSGPLATPALGNGLAIGLGARGELLAVDLQSGEVRWRRHLRGEFKARKPHYGFSTSPRIVGDQLLVALGGYRQALVSLDLADGSLLWAAGDDAIDYQSPMLWRTTHGARILLAGNNQLMSFDPKTGEVHWQQPHEGAGTRGSYSMMPVPAGPRGIFLAHLDDRSKFLSLDANDRPTTVDWDSRTIRNSYASAIFDAGFLYAYSSRFLTCVHAASGEQRWRSRQAGDGFPILVDGHLLIQTKDGALRLARATPEAYIERAHLQLFDDVSWNSPSFANGAVYSRSMSEIARVDLKVTSHQQAEVSESMSPLWQRLHSRIAASPNPGQILDDFLAARPQSPIVEDDKIHIFFRAEARDVVLAGDLPGTRRELPLRRLGETDLFFISLDLAPQAAFSYLFVVDYQPRLDPRNPQKAVNTVLGDDFEPIMGAQLEMSFFAQDIDAVRPRPPVPAAASGALEYLEITSQHLGRQVELAVYLPAGYADSKRQLPTLYWLGGRDALQWGQAKETLDRLIEGTLPDILVVFVLDSGVGTLGPLGDMLSQELVPTIEERFRAVPAREARALAGMGWDALAAANAGLAHSEIFGHLALQSVYALTAPDGGPVEWARRASKPYPEIYLDWGTYDLRNTHEAWSTVEDNQRLYDALSQLGFKISGGEVPEGSSWASWRRRSDRWLEKLFAPTNESRPDPEFPKGLNIKAQGKRSATNLVRILNSPRD